MAVMESRMEVAAGSEEELKALVAWPIFQEIKELRQDLRADRERTDGKIEGLRMDMTGKVEGLRMDMTGKIEALRMDMTGKIEGLRMDMTGKIEAVRKELKDDISDLRKETTEEFSAVRAELRSGFRWLLGAMITIFVPIAVVMLRLAFK